MLSSAVSRLSFIFSFDFLPAWEKLPGLVLISAAEREGAFLARFLWHFHLPVSVLGECDRVLITASQL